METTTTGSLPTLEQLFRDSAEDLKRYFAHRHEGREAVEDLVQETFLQMAKGMEAGSGSGSERKVECPRGYLFGIARRMSVAAWRQGGKDRGLRVISEVKEMAAPVEDDRVVAARETMAAMEPLQREVLEMRFSYGLSYAETAAALGIPVGTVRSRLHHAVAEVRRRMEDDDVL
ncbi:RNA polymerase sigma factor [Phragmitibacter flavus]|uniref:RNA polymerase sigma factor n=1 Tax=Phragmitibacter flavus TaxID=2576071 RepID=UPI00140B31A2|nr:RNA polymerase sigma factor [Phragmitibacter flavus]